MPFSFTFYITVPGLHNPFSALTKSLALQEHDEQRSAGKTRPVDHSVWKGHHEVSRLRPRRRPTPEPSPDPPKSRKRGWVPAGGEPSKPAVSPATYLDMPAYDEEDEREEMVADLPPAKRRRTLTDSIVSTAVNAALIGTAVGLTVYRLWRDRGKEQQHLSPPPPYQEEDYTQAHAQKIDPTPQTPSKRKTRPAHVKRPITGVRHRRTRQTHGGISAHPTSSPPPPARTPPRFASVQPEPSFSASVSIAGHDDEEDEDSQMDWLGDQLSRLVEEGKKALAREVVVMSDAKEDEVDDGAGVWEEEEPVTPSRRGSMRRRGLALALPPSYSCSSSASSPGLVSPIRLQHAHSYSHPPPSSSPYSPAYSHSSAHSQTHLPQTPNLSFKEDENAWASPELRASMERARAMYRR